MSAGKRTETNCDAADSNSDKKKKKAMSRVFLHRFAAIFAQILFWIKQKNRQTQGMQMYCLIVC